MMESCKEFFSVELKELEKVVSGVETKIEMIERDIDSKHTAMDKDVKESFDRIHDKIRDLSRNQLDGCPALKLSDQKTKDGLKALDKSCVSNTDNIGDVSTVVAALPSVVTIRWAVGIVISSMFIFSSYLTSEFKVLHTQVEVLDKTGTARLYAVQTGITKELVRLNLLAVEKIQMQRQVNKSVDTSLTRINTRLNIRHTK